MRLKIQNYSLRIQALKLKYTNSYIHEPLPVKDRLRISIQECGEHIKIADEYTAITKQYAERRYARINQSSVIPIGPTLVELLLSELPVMDYFLEALSEQVDKLLPANTYGYIATTNHQGVVFLVLLYYGRRADIEHLKVFLRQQNTGSFTSGLQDIFGPEIKRGREVFTFILAIPNTIPNLKGIRKEEFTTIRNLIANYSNYMRDIRKANIPNEEYKSLWLVAFTQLIKDFGITSVSNKSESFLQAHSDAVRLEVEISRMREMLDMH